jgi:hypothetical protein
MQVAARGSDVWLRALPNCWQRCFANTEDGCSSSSCKLRLSRIKGRADNTTGVCSTAESSESYLSKAVSCAVQKCDAEEFVLELALGPLQLLCFGLGCPISKDVMDEAYAAASDTEPSAPNPTNSRKADQTTSRARSEAPEVTSIIRSTLTQTTTDSNGNTLQVVVPIAVGPSGIVTGSFSTSTMSGQATTTSATTSLGPLAEPSLPELSLFSPLTPTAAPQRTGTGSSSGGNGSPFDMAGTASRWSIPIPLLGLGVLAIRLLRI